MTPRFKGVPRFDLSTPCPLCGHRIQPNEMVRLGLNLIQCAACNGVFDGLGKKKPLSTS